MRKKMKNLSAFIMASMMAVTLVSSPYLNIYADQGGKEVSVVNTKNKYDDIRYGMIDTKNYDYLALNESMESEEEEYELVSDYEQDVFMSSAESVSEEVGSEFPSSIDWSTSEYFPAVGNQNPTGSCWYYGNIYASLTFSLNKAEGVKTTKDNTLNPMFGYNYAQKTSITQHNLVRQLGYPEVGVVAIDNINIDTLFPKKEIWESAVRNRALKLVEIKVFGEEDSVITGPKDASLNQIKKTLNDGYLCATSVLAYNWNKSVIASGEHKGEVVVDRCDLNKLGGHIISIVGYDDDVWTDINYDGEVQEAELGAFKIVNSWGDSWANKGFIWVAYDALNAKSQILTAEEEARINKAIDAGTIKATKVNNSVREPYFWLGTYNRADVREKSSSECLCYMTVNTGSRKEMTMSVTATSKEDGTKQSYTFPKLNKETVHLAWDGIEYSTDGTMVFDLDNVIPDITPETMEDYNWEVKFEDDTLDEYSLTVKDLYFTVNGAKKYITGISKVPLNKTSKTYNMKFRTSNYVEDSELTKENDKNVIIYYNNSNNDDTNIHYGLYGVDSEWTDVPGVQMCRSDEQTGYKWKYVINLGDSDTVKICFNDRNEEDYTWDNNGRKNYIIESAGCYGIKDGKITKLTEKEVEIEPLIELDKTRISLKVSEEATITPSVIDGSVNDIEWSSSDEKVAIVNNGKVTAVSEGIATITAKIGEVKATCEVKVDKKVEPLTGTLTIAGATSTITKTVGDKITLDAKASGGSGNYTYKFAVLNVNTGKWTVLQNFSANASYTLNFSSAGTKQFAVTVKDSEGNTVSTNRITAKVTKPVTELKGTLKVNNSTASLTKTKGSKITLNASASGGSGSYTYKFAVLNVNTRKWSVLKDFSSTSSYTYSLDYTGTKQFAVTVKDSTGKTVATNRITVKVVKETLPLSAKLTANGVTSNVTASVGESLKLDVIASGGSGSYTYKYVVYNVNTKTWFTLKNFNTSSTYTTKLSSAGTKQFVVTVKDSTGKTVSTERVTVNTLS